jgi:hypothetical protein
VIKAKDIGRITGLDKVTGLGDAIEVLTKATGVKAVVDAISEATGKDCGCKKRKERLNKFISFKTRYDVSNNITGEESPQNSNW